MTLPNPARGEVVLLVDGEPRRLCLTLGALASLETIWGGQDLSVRLRQLTAGDLLVVIAALALDPDVTVDRLRAARIDPGEAARAVGLCFELAFA